MPSAAEIAALRAALATAGARAALSNGDAMIAALKLEIEKLRRALYGTRSERKARLLEQLELQLEKLEAAATEDELAAERVAVPAKPAGTTGRRRPARKPFPEHLPRERVVIEAPSICGCCGSARIVKLGEDITETLEVIPRQWKVIRTVREKFTCRDCERITQPPAPFHPTPRGWAGPNLLATILFESEPSKAPPVRARWRAGQHQPLNRQAERYAREGVELSLSTLADQVGACAAALAPLHDRIAAHVLSAGRLHGDDTPGPVLAKGKTDTGRLWGYVRDDRPFAGGAPPAALFRYSRDRRGVHPAAHLAGWSGILQADAFAGFGKLFAAGRHPGPATQALCWAHARRKFFELANIAAVARSRSAGAISPIALVAVTRIDAVFDAERTINGTAPEPRLAARQAEVAPLVAGLEAWMRNGRARLSRHAPVAKAMDYMLKRWDGFARFTGDGRTCLTNNAAERALRGVALGRKAWLFADSERGGDRAAFMYSLIETAKLNEVDPQAWLPDVLGRVAGTSASRLDDLLPWNWPGSSAAAEPGGDLQRPAPGRNRRGADCTISRSAYRHRPVERDPRLCQPLPAAVPDRRLPRPLMIRCRPARLTRATSATCAAGFDLICLYGPHGFGILQHFLSRATNQRSDEYGGSLENRSHFVREVIADMRDGVGDTMVLTLRVSLDETIGDLSFSNAELRDPSR